MATRADIAEAAGKPWFKGTDVTLVWTLNPVMDTTGWTIKFRMARQKGGALALDKSCTPGGASGTFFVTLADTDTDPLAPGMYVYEAKRMDTGLEAILAYGDAELLKPVGTD